MGHAYISPKFVEEHQWSSKNSTPKLSTYHMYFTDGLPFSLPIKPARVTLLLSLFHRWDNWSSEKLYKLPVVTQKVCQSRIRIQTQASWTPRPNIWLLPCLSWFLRCPLVSPNCPYYPPHWLHCLHSCPESLHTFLAFPGSSLGSPQPQPRFHGTSRLPRVSASPPRLQNVSFCLPGSPTSSSKTLDTSS